MEIFEKSNIIRTSPNTPSRQIPLSYSKHSDNNYKSTSSKSYLSACIYPSNKGRNIYSYCDSTFESNKLLKFNCNIDSCRLCCATHDDQTDNKVDFDLNSEKSCFQECATKFRKVDKMKE